MSGDKMSVSYKDAVNEITFCHKIATIDIESQK
jgi:hypothetical protein